MKGFPNQVADLEKLATAIRVIDELKATKKDPKDDGVFGEALVRVGVAGPGHTASEVERYLAEQRRKPASNQSFRTTARGLRELFRLMGLIDDSGERLRFTDLGRQAIATIRANDAQQLLRFWRKVIGDIRHAGKGAESHPYQVMLRLIARKPGLSRAKCALALVALDDSPEELERIVTLANLSEEEIQSRIHVSKANWDNAKKVLPRFAEQLGDVVRSAEGTYILAASPGASPPSDRPDRPVSTDRARRAPQKRAAPRKSREVTPRSIASAGTVDDFDEYIDTTDWDPASVRAAIEQRRARLRRHNKLVRCLAEEMSAVDATLYEDPFDLLAVWEEYPTIVAEVKSLDGSEADERERVREALAQLLYYEAFAINSSLGGKVKKVACFEAPVSDSHREWLNAAGIAVIWQHESRFCGDDLAVETFSGCAPRLLA